MRVWIGATRTIALVRMFEARGISRVMCPAEWFTPHDTERVLVDNGAFSAWKARRPWDETPFLRMVDRLVADDVRVAAVVLPDIVGGGNVSLDHSLRWLPRLPPEWSKWLVTQDGMGYDRIDDVMTHIGGIFIGGTDRHKQAARDLVALADTYGLPAHYGRASSLANMQRAWESGCTSADTSQPCWTSGGMRNYLLWCPDGYYRGNAEGLIGPAKLRPDEPSLFE